MQIHRQTALGLAFSFLFLAAGTSHVAAHGDKAARKTAEDVAMAQQAKVALRDAIGIAEQKTGARAVSAELEGKWNGLRYEVKLVQGTTVQKVDVDAASGAVLQVRPAHTD
jgi:uncharacterized membrane protein YkoI